MTDESKVIVYDNGDMLDKEKCRAALFMYWDLSVAEKRAFDRLKDREDLKDKYLTYINSKMSSKTKVNDRFTQGYICAVTTLITMSGEVDTRTRELFKAGIGNDSIEDLVKAGCDEHDIEIITKHWKELQNIYP